MILSEQDIAEISLSAVTVKDAIADVRAVEAAILAKLASAELPEPATVTVLKEIPYYTADQLRQAYAQGAAAQLAEPIYQYKRGDDSWVDQTKTSYDYNVKHGASQVRIVYTRRQAND